MEGDIGVVTAALGATVGIEEAIVADTMAVATAPITGAMLRDTITVATTTRRILWRVSSVLL